MSSSNSNKIFPLMYPQSHYVCSDESKTCFANCCDITKWNINWIHDHLKGNSKTEMSFSILQGQCIENPYNLAAHILAIINKIKPVRNGLYS